MGLSNHIVLGTVQTGIPYGKHKNKPLCSEQYAYSIFQKGWDLGIRSFDTAQAYGLSSSRLSGWLKNTGCISRAHVITKISPSEIDCPLVLEELIKPFQGACTITVLTHGSVQDDIAWNSFVKNSRILGFKYGQSVYTVDEVRNACQLGCELIQAPGNVLDDRQIQAANSESIPFDIRSVFLQGILLDDASTAEARVAGGGRLASAVREIAEKLQFEVAKCLIWSAFNLVLPNGRLVLGADSPDDLENWDWHSYQPEIGAKFKQDLLDKIGFDMSNKILDPRSWSS